MITFCETFITDGITNSQLLHATSQINKIHRLEKLVQMMIT